MDKKRITVKKKIKFKKKRNLSFKPLNFYKQKMMKGGMMKGGMMKGGMMKGGMDENQKNKIIKLIESCKEELEKYKENITAIETLIQIEIKTPNVENPKKIIEIIDNFIFTNFKILQDELSKIPDYDKLNISTEMIIMFGYIEDIKIFNNELKTLVSDVKTNQIRINELLNTYKRILTPITNDLVKISEEFTPVTPDPKIIPGNNIVIIAKKNEQGGGFKEIKYGEIDDATFFDISSKNAYNSL